jgi:deoxyribodipyrimidine photo-lyase
VTAPALVWFRHDLRLADNPALAAAAQRGGPVLPVFIWAPEEDGPWPPGAASRWWLHQSLAALDTSLRQARSRLILRRGPTRTALESLLRQTGATAVLWNRRYEPASIQRDTALRQALRQLGIETRETNAGLLHEPGTIHNQSGRPFQVFTPFWRRCLAQPDPPEPLPQPASLPAPRRWPASLPLADLQLEPRPDWARGFRAAWHPGETGARSNLQRFLAEAAGDYATARNRPDQPGTSRLSPHLHFGEIGPRQVWAALRRLDPPRWRQSQFVAELGWREFAHHLLFHFPHTPEQPLRSAFARFPWQRHTRWLQAWQQGRTGYPLVDAGLRELWHTGWMHNRVRMVVASFLVKHLRIHWTAGAKWFWDTLVDADLASNTLGWQWTAGCGADAAPYFRVFNPVAQGQKFDPQGAYVRRWIPELAALPDKWIHQPWTAPPDALRHARVDLGRTYPQPIVNHFVARELALEAYAATRHVS